MDIPDKLDYEILGDVQFGSAVTVVDLHIWGIAQNAEVDYVTTWVSDAKTYDEMALQIAEHVLGPLMRKPTPDEVMPE